MLSINIHLQQILHVCFDNHRSFWASWWVWASRCDSESCPPHKLHICPPACKSRPPCRSLHAVCVWCVGEREWEREKDGTVNRVNPMPRPDNDTILGKSWHEKKLQTSVFFLSLMMKHVGSVPRHSRNVAKTQSSCPAVIKLNFYVQGEYWDQIVSLWFCVWQRFHKINVGNIKNKKTDIII